MAFYRTTEVQELIPWTPNLPMGLVSISAEDKKNGSPKEGDMIVINPKDETDFWLISKQFFKENYEWVSDS